MLYSLGTMHKPPSSFLPIMLLNSSPSPIHPPFYPLPACLPALHPRLGHELQRRRNCSHFKCFKALVLRPRS
ncbi:uncharacterized [Tachysurus ichikawai]